MYFECILTTLLYLTIAAISIRLICTLSMGWNKSNVCLVGKTAIITGGRSGLGFQTALILASRGARVILADRGDSSKARKEIIEITKNPNIIGKFIDLADLGSIRKFVGEINNEEKRLDILINNAGAVGWVPGYTKDGLQVHTQINHLGPFLLTHLLVDKLKKSAPSRIIFVSSSSAFTAFLKLDSLTDHPRGIIPIWDNYVHYSKTKLFTAISAMGFAEKLKGTGVTCNALHPGIVLTKMVENMFSVRNNEIGKIIWYTLAKVMAKTPYEGAQTQAYVAMANEVKNVTGRFFVDCRTWFQPFPIRNKKLCEEIWKRSEQLVRLEPEEKLEEVLKE